MNNLLKKVFGEKIEEENLEFSEALVRIEELYNTGAKAAYFELNQISADPMKKENPEKNYVVETLQTLMAPYHYKHDPRLKGNTLVKYTSKDFSKYQEHCFEFKQVFDNLFKKNNKGSTAKLKLRDKK